MNLDAHTVVNRLILELVQRPSREMELRGDDAHPLLIERLRQVANIPSWAEAGKIEVEINHQPWDISVSIVSGFLGDRVKLAARERR